MKGIEEQSMERSSVLPYGVLVIEKGAFRSPSTTVANGQPKQTVAAIMMLNRNTKVKVRSPDGDTDYFDIVAGVPQGDT